MSSRIKGGLELVRVVKGRDGRGTGGVQGIVRHSVRQREGYSPTVHHTSHSDTLLMNALLSVACTVESSGSSATSSYVFIRIIIHHKSLSLSSKLFSLFTFNRQKKLPIISTGTLTFRGKGDLSPNLCSSPTRSPHKGQEWPYLSKEQY